MSLLQIHQFPCLSDNYGFLVHERLSGVTATIDTPDPRAIHRELKRKRWRLTHILNTHHHADHAGGNLWLKERTGCVIVGPSADAARIPGIDLQVGEGEILEFGNTEAHVYDTPGHTSGHIVYHFADEDVAFVGDTLFSMGLRPPVRRLTQADVELAAEADELARAHTHLLRARIHAIQRALCADRGPGTTEL